MKSVREFSRFLGVSAPISVSALARKFGFSKPISLLHLLCVAHFADCMTQLLASGPPGTKLNLVVMGDGFAAGNDQTIFDNKVNDLLFNGLFNHDFFSEQKQAFNVYRINLISNDSGVGTKKYDNGNLLSTVEKDTALKMYFSGSWSHCWLEGGPNSGTLINNALDRWVPDHDLVLVLLNNPGYGGCGGGGRAYLPLGVTWDTVAHEFGHGLGGLGDEYCTDKTCTGASEPSVVNLTVNTDRTTLKWKNYIDSTTPVPTGKGKCAGYTEGTKPITWDDSQSVGLFEGGGYCNLGMYRPVINCRMRSNSPPFCPVCYDEMKKLTNDYMPSNESSAGYVRFTVHVESGKLSVTDIKDVPGPFVVPNVIGPGHAYEVLIGDESIALGSLPDVGVRRSFANRDVPGPEGTHHITALPSFDFFARIPKSHITRDTLPKLTIAVLKVQQVPDRLLRSVPLTKHAGLRSTEVGRLTGISMDKLPEAARPQLERILSDEPK